MNRSISLMSRSLDVECWRESQWKICKSKLNYLQRYQLHSTFIPMLICFADLLKNGYISHTLTLFLAVALLQYALPTSTSKFKYYTTDERKSREWWLRRQNVRARFFSQLMHKFIQIKMLYLIYFCLAVCRCIFYFVCWLVVIRLC